MADLTAMLQAAAGAAVQPGGEYQISRSLRFNSADSAYLSRTHLASMEVKRQQLLLGSGISDKTNQSFAPGMKIAFFTETTASGTGFAIRFNLDDTIISL
jgi:hypothetical protein